ncbi:MAG TPA: diguanylate cyclase [Burkholderiales bacterium]|nr:diguanylate cyclase [Burkholderiales bacterium]
MKKKRAPKATRRRTPVRTPASPARALLSLSSDWYWETDTAMRFTRIMAHNRTRAEQARLEELLGKTRWGTGFEAEDGWEAHRAVTAARKPFRDLVVWRTLEDGSRVCAAVSGEPIFDAKGAFRGYRGIGRDITRQKRAEELLRLEHSVTRFLAKGLDAPEALRAALRAICETECWDCAEFWKLDEPAQVMRLYAHFAMPGLADAAAFIEGSRELQFAQGAGLIGAAWQSAEPLWVADTRRDPRVLRHELSRRTGLAAALLVPVRVAGRIVGVLSFTCRQIRQPETHLMQALGVIAGQIGQFLQRADAEAAAREGEARFRALTNLSSDWYWELDAEYRFTRLEGRHVAGGDETLLARLLGKRRWETGLSIEGGWDAHRLLLESRQPFHDALMWRAMKDGTIRYMSVSGEPVIDADGRFAGYRGVGRDVSAQKRAELMLKLEHRVAAALADADDAASGLRLVMRAVCIAEGWSCARYLRLDGERLVYQEGWSSDDSLLLESSKGLSYRSGEGLAGAVLRDGETLWCPDVTKDPRAHKAALSGITETRGVFAFPAVVEGRVCGVFTFSSHTVRKPDQRLLQASGVIGSQVGQFLSRKSAEGSLRESETRFRNLTEMSSDFYWITDPSHRVAQIVHGPNYPEDLLHGAIGKASWDLASVRPDEAAWAAHRATLDSHAPFRDFEFARRVSDGTVRHYAISGEPRFGAGGDFLGYHGVGRDITDVALARERIASLAYSDPLTGLANRASLGPSLDQAVQRARRRDAKLAVVFLDLDGFKQINDLHGHDAGDGLLVDLAGRLRGHLRASDLIARLGGDEFLVVLEEVIDLAPVETVARKLLAEARHPYSIGGRATTVTASIGISVFPDDASDAGALMKHADTAMYAAKQAGKNTYRFYSSGRAANEPLVPPASSAETP